MGTSDRTGNAPSNGSNEPGRLGLWLVGARGSIATCVVYGLFGLKEGLLEPVGLVTETGPLARLPLRRFDRIVVGGHEIARGDLSHAAAELVQNGVLDRELVTAGANEAARYDERVRSGLLDEADLGSGNLDPEAVRRSGELPRRQVEELAGDIERFRAENQLERVVVCCVSSTEAYRELAESAGDLASFEEALDAGASFPASSLYAYAALRAGAPFVNFTPNAGASPPALRELAKRVHLPHCGNDAKTGETLLKTALAPVFVARALRVLSWQGYNMLGNADGRSLSDPIRQEAKLRTKDHVLKDILGGGPHTGVGIDYVPSLHDWKTAWDFVHFEGFLGARMSLQFTWMGCDSALAAPLVLDLARLADFAAACGESGPMDHTACFFKSPLSGGTHDFHRQFGRLLAYAERHLADSP